MSKNYSSKDIRVLKEIEHVQMHPGMYISDTTNPVHLVEEALDNSLDEALAGYAKCISVNINTKTFEICVLDNGRGIPFENDVPITISTKLFSGAKFQGAKTAYNICAGLHGIGLVAVNALSEYFQIEIIRDKKYAKFRFENCNLKEKEIKDFTEKTIPYGTLIKFKPSKKIFENLLPDIERIRRRLFVASIELPDCLFVLNVDKHREEIKLSKDEFFKRALLDDKEEVTQLAQISTKDGIEEFNAVFCYSFEGSISPRILSSVNLLPVDSGGTHVNILYEILKEFFISRGKKLGLKFQPNDSFCGLRTYVSLELIKPEFSGQSKDKLINRKASLSKLSNKLKQGIELYFNENPEYLTTLLTFFEDYRRKIDSKKLKTNGEKRFSTKFTKLRGCSSSNGELFVVEGDSAGGGLKQCRDPKKHAYFPLKGKIPSIVTSKDILKNVEIGELIQALGTGVGSDFNLSKLRYSKIICATDADADGGHIFCLLTMTLANLVPDIIKNGHYYLVRTPLYAISKKNIFLPLWTEKELEEARKRKEYIIRLKGLGQLNPWQLKICTIDEKTRKLVKVNFTKDLNEMMKLFSDVNAKRLLLKNDKEEDIVVS